MKKKYIVFDFDGTLANTNEIIIASWQATLEHYLGHTLPRREIEATFGEILMYTIGRLIPGAPVNEVVDYYRAYQDANNDGAVWLFDGIRELLDELHARGHMIGVATSRTAYSLRNYLKELGLDGDIDRIVTMEDVTNHKPEPDSLNAVLSKMTGCPANHLTEEIRRESIMIGDTKYDIGCANNAGVDSVLVGWSHYVDEEDMAEHCFAPTYRIEKPEDLLAIV